MLKEFLEMLVTDVNSKSFSHLESKLKPQSSLKRFTPPCQKFQNGRKERNIASQVPQITLLTPLPLLDKVVIQQNHSALYFIEFCNYETKVNEDTLEGFKSHKIFPRKELTF